MKKIITTRLFPIWKYKVLLLAAFYMALTVSVAGAGVKSDTVRKKDSCCNTVAVAKTQPADDVDPNLVLELTRFGNTAKVLAAVSDVSITDHLYRASVEECAPSKSVDCDAWTNLQVSVNVLEQHSAKNGVHAAEAADHTMRQRFLDEFTLRMPRGNDGKLLKESDNGVNHFFARQYGMELVSLSE